ncbi:MAG TPA: UDP-N-acetylmuramoyl-tripeptide--D-alanyl-D-alanine ligase [bacterium]|nr:UDP-N-acetylmuramoyl-tripeptide--D-alanyl-D-alanine ligase [bacterium]
MLPWTLREVAALTNGRMVGDPDRVVKGVVHDTRNVKKGDLFTAIRGARFDGHRFVKEAAEKGAAAVLVTKRVTTKVPQVLVADTTRALGDLGRSQRLQWGGPLVAVTGSVGKTTVKDMTAWLLEGSRRVLKTEGNLNNHWGLPLTLLRLEKGHQAAVVELGINHPGEMEGLSDIARPDVAVVTRIGEAHLEFFRDRRQLAREKMMIAAHLREGGRNILNANDALLRTNVENVVTFGLKLGQVRALNLESEGLGTRFEIAAQGERVPAELHMPGLHNVSNATAAVAAGLALGLPLRKLVQRLASFRSQAPMRMEIKNLNGILFVNDAYNASPTSMEAALLTFDRMQGPKRKWAVLGDMLELGEFSPETHYRIVKRALETSIDRVVLVGPRMGRAFERLEHPRKEKAQVFEDVNEARAFLRRSSQKGDAVLLKASRGMKLERVLEGF